MSAGGRQRVLVLCSALLAACAQLGERQFSDFLTRFQADPEFRAAAAGPLIWVTETTVWQDAAGYDRRVSCTAIRSLDWLGTRGYRMIPTPEEARTEGLVVTSKTRSAVTADVTVSPPKSEPHAIYSFYRESGKWQLVAVEIVSRVHPDDGKPPAYRCLATEA